VGVVDGPFLAELVREAAAIGVYDARAVERLPEPEHHRVFGPSGPTHRYALDLVEPIMGLPPRVLDAEGGAPRTDRAPTPCRTEAGAPVDESCTRDHEDWALTEHERASARRKHVDGPFWSSLAFGDVEHNAFCQAHPRFELLGRYLVLLDAEGRILNQRRALGRAVQRVEDPDDQWLYGVRALVTDPRRDAPLDLSLRKLVVAHRAFALGRVAACGPDWAALSVDRLTAPAIGETPPVTEIAAWTTDLADGVTVTAEDPGFDRIVDAETGDCTRGAAVLLQPARLGFGAFRGYRINLVGEGGTVSFTPFGAQVRLTDDLQATVSEVDSWFVDPNAAPQRLAETGGG
jgi:hypothetical protein